MKYQKPQLIILRGVMGKIGVPADNGYYVCNVRQCCDNVNVS